MIKKAAAKKIFFLFLLAGGIFLFRLVFAQDLGLEIAENNFGGTLGESGTDLRSIIANIINIALGFLGILAVGIALYAGFLWMTSNGEEDKVTRAKQILKMGAIGLIIILSAWVIVTFVINKLTDSGVLSPGPNSSYCLEGDTMPCGCGGVATCTNGRFGLCVGSNNEDCVNPPASCNASSLLSGCQASDQICADGYFCNTNCSCEPKASLGDSCDGDQSNQTCDADNNKCGEYLTCSPDTCQCSGSPVITAISPAGGFCSSDINRACSINADCAAGDTCDTATPNGANDNFVTIFGSNFGEYSEENSQVLFSGSQGDMKAPRPQEINQACIDSWRDDQIIIAIPAGAQSGPIKVVNFENKTDSTGDEYGPQLPDFVPNTIARPGLCNIDPVEGTLNKEVNYQGVNLYSGEAYFGNYENNVSGLYSSFVDAQGLSGTAAVPNIKAGQSGSFVERDIAGVKQKSNYLRFVKEREEADGPYIMNFSPAEGAPGQYVTIRGAGFGGAKGGSRVYFVNGSNKIEASYSFPTICTNSVWNDKQIIVKVPDGLANDNYYLEIAFSDRSISSQNANPNVFTANSLLSLTPNLCKIDPVKGPIGTPVTFWGENFGAAKSSILAKFNPDKNVSSIIEKQDKADRIVAEVPLSALTGPVVLEKDSRTSNELNFLVAECLSDSECSDQVCCPQNTYKKGRCVEELSECFIDIPTSVFEWRFSTQYSSAMDPDIASCLGFAKNFGSCYQGAMCPNSPGSCSSPSTSYTKIVGACNISCNDAPGCTAATCTYNEELDRCVLKTTNIVSDCDPGELIAPAKNSNQNDNQNVPRIMYWQGKINQHWNLSIGAWEPDIDEKSGAELDKLAYCKKFYPTTIKVEEYKQEFSNTWHSAKSRQYYSGTRMSYRCVLDTNSNSLDLSGVKKTCNQEGKWEIKVKTSCPTGWTMGASGTCTQDGVECGSCPTNLSCEKIDKFNSCVSPKLCQDTQAKCIDNKASNQDDCTITVDPGCDCCCRIGFDKQDCCSFEAEDGSQVQLQCAGTCGSDITASPSTNTYGSCSGCAAAGNSQEKQDDACNCAGTSGKFCSVTGDAPQGICTDCAGLKTQEACGAHATTCCFDSRGTAATGDDVCRGIGDNEVVSTDTDNPDYGYCGYFNCSEVNPLICSGIPNKIGKYKKLADCENACPKESGDICNNFNDNKEQCLSNPKCCYDGQAEEQNNNSPDKPKSNTCISGSQIAEGDNKGYCAYYDCYSQTEGDPYKCNPIAKISGKYKGLNTCSAACGNPVGGAGLGCSDKENSALNQCNFNLCTSFGSTCLQENGLEAQSADYPSCGACCCQPAAEGVADSCKTPETPNLFCKADASESCSGANRGLCCGCSEDSQCGSPTTVGCGADSCCEARPEVVETSPAPDAVNVCRNSAIKVTFNQKMEVASFSNNFLLFEEKNYGQDTCPEGTFISEADISREKIAAGESPLKQFWNRISGWLAGIFGGPKASATPPSSGKLYCAIDSQMNFMEEAGRTSLVIIPKKILSPAAKYFVLVKGDETLTSNSGVLSAEKIGMNEVGFTSSQGNVNPVEFNGRAYQNAYSFTFTTLADQGAHNGICEVDYVKITPSSYLFQKTDNDLNEDDTNPRAASFDTVRDGDKLFSAGAYSVNNQLLRPVPGYNWDWSWKITNTSIANFSSRPVGLEDSRRLIEANPKITDGQTQASASIDMSAYRDQCGNNCNYFFTGDKISQASDVYVFSCANPWPAVNPDGTWQPWQDSGNNCEGAGACDNFNYKFYYCRDAGQSGTFDDLPVINPSPVSLTGSLVCSSDKTPCSNSGSACDNGAGVCIWEILKESYFFRDAVLSGVEITDLIDTKQGGEAEVKWQSSAEGVSTYKIYYLKSGGGTMLSKEVRPTGPGGACVSGGGGQNFVCSTKIGGLIDGETYVFRVSALSSSKAESALSIDKAIKISDATPPVAPVNIKVSATETAVKFSWDKNAEEGVFYRAYYGINPGQYFESVDTNPGVNEAILLRSKFSGSSYYLAVSALDKSKNESAKSAERNFIIENNTAWLKSLRSEATVGKECLVKMNISATNANEADCSKEAVSSNSKWFKGIITLKDPSFFCSIPGCNIATVNNRCGYTRGTWATNCYININ